jgi:hypothetical protein
MSQILAVFVVDLRGRNAFCSHCNQPASDASAPHSCGAGFDRIAIDAEYSPTFRQAGVVSRMYPGKEFIGTGRIVPGTKDYWFQADKRPGDLS